MPCQIHNFINSDWFFERSEICRLTTLVNLHFFLKKKALYKSKPASVQEQPFSVYLYWKILIRRFRCVPRIAHYIVPQVWKTVSFCSSRTNKCFKVFYDNISYHEKVKEVPFPSVLLVFLIINYITKRRDELLLTNL